MRFFYFRGYSPQSFSSRLLGIFIFKITSTLGKIERGIQGFSIDLLIEIGIFFGISTDYILIGCEIRNYEAAKELDSVINQLVALKMKL